MSSKFKKFIRCFIYSYFNFCFFYLFYYIFCISHFFQISFFIRSWKIYLNSNETTWEICLRSRLNYYIYILIAICISLTYYCIFSLGGILIIWFFNFVRIFSNFICCFIKAKKSLFLTFLFKDEYSLSLYKRRTLWPKNYFLIYILSSFEKAIHYDIFPNEIDGYDLFFEISLFKFDRIIKFDILFIFSFI